MTRRTQPVDLGPPPPDAPDAVPSLPVLCDDVGRNLRAAGGRIIRAADDLTGPARDGFAAGNIALGHQDVWRCEADARRAARDLLAIANGLANWRRQRDAEVQAASE